MRSVWWVTLAGLSAAATGLVVLFAYSLSEVMADPSLSLVDGYWVGRLPWTALGVDLAVSGATVAVVFAALTVWLAGGAVPRAVGTLALGTAAFWWFLAMIPPRHAVPCTACPPVAPDPLAVAYSQPENTLLFLLLPAAVAGVVALTRRRARRSATPKPATS